ncbi:MAG: hypothetical protein R2734_19220 [Nocardioides sp.]
MPSAGRVLDLAAARRRRRRFTQALVAAAAVAVVGFAGPALLRDATLGGSDSGTSAGDAPAAQPEASTQLDAGTESGNAPSAQASDNAGGRAAPGDTRGQAAYAATGPVRLRADRFDRDAARAFGLVQPTAPALLASKPAEGELLLPKWQTCSDEGVGAGDRVPARYRGQRGWLVFRDPVDGTTQAEFFPCGATTPTRGTQLAVR